MEIGHNESIATGGQDEDIRKRDSDGVAVSKRVEEKSTCPGCGAVLGKQALRHHLYISVMDEG